MRLILILFYSLYIHVSLGQTQSKLEVNIFPDINNINSKSLLEILQSKSGYMWMGSPEGLLRYDGYNIRSYKNPTTSSPIKNIIEDSKGKLWISYFDGSITEFNPSNGIFRNINLIDTKGNKLTGYQLKCLYKENDSIIWAGTARKGLLSININSGLTQQYDIIKEDDPYYSSLIAINTNKVNCIVPSKKGNLWLGTDDGLYIFNIKSKKMISLNKRPPKSTDWRDDAIQTMVEIGNTLWLGAWGGGISEYNIQTKTYNTYKLNLSKTQSTTHNIIITIIPKDSNSLWLASLDAGLGHFDITTKKFYLYNTNKEYPDIPKALWKSLTKDKEGSLWAITEKGLTKITLLEKKFNFKKVTVTQSTNREFYELMDIWEDDFYKLIAFQFADGLHVYNKKAGTRKILSVDFNPVEEPNQQVKQILKSKNNIFWVLTRDYIYQYNYNNQSLKKIPQPAELNKNFINLSPIYTKMEEDKEGNIWFASVRNGLVKYSTATQTYSYFLSQNNFAHAEKLNGIADIVCDNFNRIWIIGFNNFIGFFDEGKKNLKPFLLETGNTNITPAKRNALFKDSKERLWLSTWAGVYLIDSRSQNISVVKKISTSSGLKNDLLTGLTEDKQGNIWGVSTMAYIISCIKVNGQILNYGLKDGINQPGDIFSIKHATGDSMYALLQGGIYSFTGSQQTEPPPSTNLVLSIMAVNSIDKFFEEDLKHSSKLILEPNENSFYFEYTAIDYKHPELYDYAYMLEGWDKIWVEAGNRRAVSYTNIPGGNYTFKVKATNKKGEWNVAAISVPFYIKTPIYKRWWFILMTIIATSALIYFIVSTRFYKQKQLFDLASKTQSLQKEKTAVQYENLKQQLNPHFLFNSLSSLGGLIRSNPSQASVFLESMSKTYRYILKSKNNELTNLGNEVEFIQNFIRLQTARFGDGLIIVIDIEEKDYDYKIVPVTLQNLIENAIKHNITDKESPLKINLFIQNQHLVVSNNLQRKSIVEGSNKQGLQNMISLYQYLTDRPVLVEENKVLFTVKIPLI